MLKSTKVFFNKNPSDTQIDTPPTIRSRWAEEVKRAEVLINIGVFIVGLGTFAATLWVTLVAQSFSEKQAIRAEYIEFLRKTNDHLNTQWEKNSNLLSFLYAEAEYKQTLLEYIKPPEDILKSIQFYRQNSQQIHIALQQNESHLRDLAKFVPEKERIKYQDNVVHNILEHKNVFTLIKHLNQALNYMANDSFDLAEKELSILIEEYTKIYHVSFGNPTSYLNTVCGSRLATFYNLRSLNRIKKAQIKRKEDGDILSYCKLMESIAIEDCKSAEKLNPNNFYSYLHTAYVYREIYRYTKDEFLKNNYLSIIRENTLKAFKIAPLNASTLISLGYYQTTIKEYLSALSYFKEALFLHPNNPIILYNLAKIYLDLGQTQNDKKLLTAAFNYAEQANQIKPVSVKTLTLLIKTALVRKKCDKAFEAFDSLKISCSKDPSCKREKILETVNQLLLQTCRK